MRLLAAAAVLVALSARAFCGTLEEGGVRVVHGPGQGEYAGRVLGICRDQATELRSHLDLRLPEDLTVTLVGEGEFSAELGPERAKLYSAFARPSERTVVLHMGRVEKGRVGGFGRVLRHELVHLAIGELVRGKGVRVPRWLDEGLAMLYGDLPMELDRRELVSAVGSGSLIPLGELAGAFPDDTQPRVHLAYLEAESAVRRLRGLQGEKGLRELLARLGRGEKFEAAFAVVYGMPLERFGAEWAESLSTGSRALDWVRGVLSWTSMFTYLAALVVVAFLVQRLRRSRRKEEMDGGGEGEGGP